MAEGQSDSFSRNKLGSASKIQIAITMDLNNHKGYTNSMSIEIKNHFKAQIYGGYAIHRPTINGTNTHAISGLYYGLGITKYKSLTPNNTWT